jgi:FtsH-binding integral membrane protein
VDIKAEALESKVVKTTPEENVRVDIVEMPPTEVSEDAGIQPTKTSLFRRLFKIEATPRPVTNLTLFLRKVYLLLLVEMVFTALWIGTVTLSSELQGAMRRNYWLVVFWFFILLDVLWVKCRFPAVTERKEGAVMLTVLQVWFT